MGWRNWLFSTTVGKMEAGMREQRGLNPPSHRVQALDSYKRSPVSISCLILYPAPKSKLNSLFIIHGYDSLSLNCSLCQRCRYIFHFIWVSLTELPYSVTCFLIRFYCTLAPSFRWLLMSKNYCLCGSSLCHQLFSLSDNLMLSLSKGEFNKDDGKNSGRYWISN